MTLRELDGKWMCRKSKKAKTEEDVSDIIEFIAPDVASLMGKSGRTEFHAYLCKQGNRWEQMYGVTSLLSYWGEKDKLVQWAVDRGIEYIREYGMASYNELTGEVANYRVTETLLEASSKAHKRSLNEAGASGTAVHAEVEAYIKKAIENGGKLPGMVFHGSPQAQLFQKWAEEENVTFLASEKVVYSKRLFCAGTMDFLCEINGRLTIGDVKTSNWISPKHFLQCGAYAEFYEEPLKLDRVATGSDYESVQGIVIVQLPRDGGIKVVTNNDVGMAVDNLKDGFEKVVQLVRMDKDISTNLYM